MIDINALQNYYESEISPSLGALRGIMNVAKYIIIFTLMGFANFFIGIGGDNGLIVSGIIVGVGFLLLYLNNKNLNSFYKDKITLPIIKQIENDEKFSFNLTGSIEKSEIVNSKIFYFSENHTLAQSKLLTYEEENRTIKMLNVQVENTTHDADGDTDTTTTEGLFVVVPTQMKIRGTTILFPDIAEKVGGFTGELLQSKKMDDLRKIRLDSPDFEKEFIVYGDDALMAHYLLKHTVMEVLSEVSKKFPFQFQISFIEGRVYLFFSFSGGWFEPEVELDKKKEDSLSFETIRKDIEVIQTAIDIARRIEKHHHIY